MDATAKIKLYQKIKDDSLDTDALKDYALLLEIGMNSFRFAIVDTVDNRCLWLEDYRFSSVFFVEQVLDQLNPIFENHELLRAGFWGSVRVALKNRNFTLVPQPLLSLTQTEKYLHFTTKTEREEEEPFCYTHPNSDMVSVFSGDRRLVQWVKGMYASRTVSFVHHTSALIEGVVHHVDYVPARGMYILVEPSYLTILVMHNYQVEYCNTFFYLSTQDFVYYVMLVMDELKLNPDACRLTLYGEITPDSAIYDSLYKYVRNIGFGTKHSAIKFGFRFDEMLDQQYFDLFSLYLCS